MDDPNITMEKYIRLEEEKARRRGKVFNWETAKYGRIWYDEDIHDLRSIETEFPAIVFNDNLTSNETLSCEPTVSSLNNNEIDFRISFDESDDEDYMTQRAYKELMRVACETVEQNHLRRCEEDVIRHIGKVLEIVDLVKIAGVDPFQLRMKAFPLSLLKEARKWWMNEGDGNITTWEELVKKFFKKFYPLSCASNYDMMMKKVVIHSNSYLAGTRKIGNEEGLLNDEVLSDEEWDGHEYWNPLNDLFHKPNLNINNKMDKNHHNENNGDANKLGGMDLSGTPHSEKINNKQPNEGVCRVDVRNKGVPS
ncbi:hypothetical protein Tco_1068129 [Tanacetum coccineum]|uniref:Retrotransposon gag domain-containing protein n=1 Tax=Tanacetum coccineum TaxID=301880 RepID=A0ABQ5HGK5_9ASTR